MTVIMKQHNHHWGKIKEPDEAPRKHKDMYQNDPTHYPVTITALS